MLSRIQKVSSPQGSAQRSPSSSRSPSPSRTAIQKVEANEGDIFQFEGKNYIVVDFDGDLIFEDKYGDKYMIKHTKNGIALGLGIREKKSKELPSSHRGSPKLKHPELEDVKTIREDVRKLKQDLRNVYSQLEKTLAKLREYDINLHELEILEDIADLANLKK